MQAALAGDAGLEPGQIEAAWVGNAAAGLVTGQECIRGQVVLRSIGMGGLPVVDVKNACASASTAFQQACAMVTAGLYDVVLALGVEKLYHPDKRKSFAAFSGAVDVGAYESQFFTASTLDDVDDNQDYGLGHLSLREALDLANSKPGKDLIRFRPDLAGTIELNLGQLWITDDRIRRATRLHPTGCPCSRRSSRIRGDP